MEEKKSDGVPDRLEFAFVGTTCTPLSLDPKEFEGRTPADVTTELLLLLSEVAPNVTFFHDDVVLAAATLTGESLHNYAE